jgi:hypothetical protein
VLDVLVTVDLLSICRQRIASGRTEFIEPTAKLIRLHAMPFVQDNSFQTLQHSDLMARMLREVAAFFFEDKPNLYLQLASAEVRLNQSRDFADIVLIGFLTFSCFELSRRVVVVKDPHKLPVTPPFRRARVWLQ